MPSPSLYSFGSGSSLRIHRSEKEKNGRRKTRDVDRKKRSERRVRDRGEKYVFGPPSRVEGKRRYEKVNVLGRDGRNDEEDERDRDHERRVEKRKHCPRTDDYDIPKESRRRRRTDEEKAERQARRAAEESEIRSHENRPSSSKKSTNAFLHPLSFLKRSVELTCCTICTSNVIAEL